MGRNGRSAKEVEQIVVDFERSGLNRREYCARRGIAIPTLDLYRRRVRSNRTSRDLVPNLVRVKIGKTATPAPAGGGTQDSFALVLANGRRIETSWNFSDDAMTRLIRIAGAT